MTTSNPSQEFSLVGVKASHLQRFVADHGGRVFFEKKTTTDVCELIIKPETSGIQDSYCELLRQTGRGDETGVATWFISHAWKYQFLYVLDAIDAFLNREELRRDVVVWFDLFSNSQHNTAA